MRAIAIGVCVCVGVMGRPAEAERFRGLYLEGWYGKIGLETGAVFARERPAAPLLGGTATFVRMNDHLEWYGLQADLLADWNGDRDAGARWSLGPEVGVSLYGIDVSYFGERESGETRHGVQLRAKLTVGLAALYIRGAYTLTGEEASSVDAGLQIKLPVFISRDRKKLRDLRPAGQVARRP